MTATTTVRPEFHRHPVFARLWPLAAAQLDKQGGAAHRRRLLGGLSGRVLEIGAADGRSFEHYPDAVDEVVAVEPEPHLRERAHSAAEHAPVPVSVIDGVVEALPLPDGAFDAVVSSLVLCSVADQDAGLAELRRVLHLGGRLRFFEHVVADRGAHRRLQQALDATVWPRLAGGCHAARDTLGAIEQAGFRLGAVERFRFPDRAPTPTSPHVLGEALAG